MTSTTPLTQPSIGPLGNQNNTPFLEATLMLSVKYTIEDPDFINPKPLLEVLKQCLKQEKIIRI